MWSCVAYESGLMFETEVSTLQSKCLHLQQAQSSILPRASSALVGWGTLRSGQGAMQRRVGGAAARVDTAANSGCHMP